LRGRSTAAFKSAWFRNDEACIWTHLSKPAIHYWAQKYEEGHSFVVQDISGHIAPDDLECEVIARRASAAITPYNPLQERRLLKDFVSIPYHKSDVDAAKEAITRFTQKYGFLGARMLYEDHETLGRIIGETLPFWREQVYKLNLLTRVQKAINCENGADRSQRTDAKDFLERIMPNHSFDNGIPPWENIIVPDFQRPCWPLTSAMQNLWDPPNVFAKARLLLSYYVNLELERHVYLSASVGRPDPLILIPKNLLGCLYVNFTIANPTAARGVKYCKDCGDPIPKERNGNAIFCSQACKERRKKRDQRHRAKLSAVILPSTRRQTMGNE